MNFISYNPAIYGYFLFLSWYVVDDSNGLTNTLTADRLLGLEVFRRESACLLRVVSDSPIGNPRLFFTWAISGFQIVVGKQDPMHKAFLTSAWVTFANVHWIKQGKWWRPDTKHEVLDFTSWWEGWKSDIRVVHKGMRGICGNFCTLSY